MCNSVTRVNSGAAPDTTDRVFIDIDRGGFYSWKGVVLVGRKPVYGGSPPEFRTAYEAEVAAVTWAMGHRVSKLTIDAGEGHQHSD